MSVATKRTAIAIGKQIHELREREGTSQERLAAKAGMTRQNFARIEAGKTNLTLDSMLRIAKALGADCHVRIARKRR